MGRALQLRHLVDLEARSAVGASAISRQRESVTQLARNGHDSARDLLLLAQFETLQELLQAERQRLRSDLEIS
jgi:hypothetical protein